MSAIAGQPEQPGQRLAGHAGNDVGAALAEVLNDLGDLRKHVHSAEGCAALQSAEKLLRAQAEALQMRDVDHELAAVHSDDCKGRLRMAKRVLPWVMPQRKRQAEMQSDAHIKAHFVENPTTIAARLFLQARFGIPCSRPGDDSNAAALRVATSLGGIVRGSNAPRPIPLSRELREGCNAAAPVQYIDREIKHGLCHLVNRGIIPPLSDLTAALAGPTNVLHAASVRLLPHHQRGAAAQVLDSEDPYRGAQLDLLQPTGTPQAAGSEAPQHGGPVDATSEDLAQQAELQREEQQAREFDQLMDEHSAHYVIIRRGRVLEQTPEYESFQRTYAAQWDALAVMLLQLESICKQYAVPLATVDGKKLAALAARDDVARGAALPAELLLACIENIQEVAAVLRQPGRRFHGPDGKAQAAVTIQAHIRGYMQRKEAQERWRHVSAARAIQDQWRVHQTRRNALARIQAARAQRDAAFAQLQQQFVQSWVALPSAHRVLVHCPSLTLAPAQRESISRVSSVPMLESAQMSRLCDVADAKTDVVYIAPAPVDTAVEQYWTKLLEAGGVAEAASRFRIVHPENYVRLPERLSLTSKILASPRALRRVKMMVQGRPAFIVPGAIGDAEIDLAVTLGIPLLGSHPAIAAAVASKSGARALFRQARMNVAPGCDVLPVEGPLAAAAPGSSGAGESTGLLMDFAMSQGELSIREREAERAVRRKAERKDRVLCERLARMMVERPLVQKWLVKLEDEDNGRGIAYVVPATVPGLADELAEVVENLSELLQSLQVAAVEGRWPKASKLTPRQAGPIEELRQQLEHRVLQLLLKALNKELRMVAPQAYPNYRTFVQAVRRRGAVIEAAAEAAIGSPSVSILVEPDASVRVIATMEQIFSPAFCAVGHTFPQTSVVHSAIVDAAVAVGKQLAAVHFMGHATIDFVVHREHGMLRMWATDLNPGPSLALASYQLFDFLAAGTFRPREGRYVLAEPDAAASSVTGGMNGSAAASEGQQDAAAANERQRFFVSCEALRHPGLAKLDYGAFFKSCRHAGKVFDLEERTGTSFALLDSAPAGVVSVISTGASLFDAISGMAHTLEFVNAAAFAASPGETASGFSGTMATMRYLAECLQPTVVRGVT